ncbi:MAG TPA: hypothetical protein VI912_05890 [Candidatus Bilamarchaeaceae archaeon]|nr:hypothetical protein [Candidatus Bilamarchaeaceae archaeon]
MYKLIILLVLVVLVVVYIYAQKPNDEGFHIHADFKVYLNGEEYNFSQEKYMSESSLTPSPFVHLHGINGEVIHVHAEGVTVGDFFDSLKIKFNESCFVLGEGTEYCRNNDKRLEMYINGNLNNQFQNYVIQDLDRILITYGNPTSEGIQNQLGKVTDNACIESRKCPERGTPSEGSCSSGTVCIVD